MSNLIDVRKAWPHSSQVQTCRTQPAPSKAAVVGATSTLLHSGQVGIAMRNPEAEGPVVVVWTVMAILQRYPPTQVSIMFFIRDRHATLL